MNKLRMGFVTFNKKATLRKPAVLNLVSRLRGSNCAASAVTPTVLAQLSYWGG